MSDRKKENLLSELVEKGAQMSRQEYVKTAKQQGIARLTLRIPRDLHRALKVYAAENDTTVQDIVVGLLQEFVKRNKD